jgi:hypothetical protein
VFPGKAEVHLAQLPQPLEGVGNDGQFLHAPEENLEALLVHGVENLVLVLEIQVDRGRAVLDAVGNLADGGFFVAFLDEQVHGGLKDQVLHFLLFPFLPFSNSHGWLD